MNGAATKFYTHTQAHLSIPFCLILDFRQLLRGACALAHNFLAVVTHKMRFSNAFGECNADLAIG